MEVKDDGDRTGVDNAMLIKDEINPTQWTWGANWTPHMSRVKTQIFESGMLRGLLYGLELHCVLRK